MSEQLEFASTNSIHHYLISQTSQKSKFPFNHKSRIQNILILLQKQLLLKKQETCFNRFSLQEHLVHMFLFTWSTEERNQRPNIERPEIDK